jgi:hypothetical protein
MMHGAWVGLAPEPVGRRPECHPLRRIVDSDFAAMAEVVLAHDDMAD